MTEPARTDVLLVVEDNPDDLHFLLRALAKTGTSVPARVARTGQEAVDYLDGPARAQDHPLAILLDLKLPVRSGFDVLEHVKHDAALRKIPVVILTSSAESTDLNRAYSLGANSYLVKPTRTEDLTRLVASIESYWLRENRVS